MNVASYYDPIVAGPSIARSHAHLRHAYDYRWEIGVALSLNVSGSHVDRAIESGLENGPRQGCSGREIGGIYRPGDHRDLQYRRSGAVWVKANDYHGAGVQVSASEVGNRRIACRCGHDAAPCARPFRVSLLLSPPCAPLCVVSVRPSPQLLSSHLDPHAHWPPLRKEGLGSHLYPCLVYLPMMIPFWMARNLCTSANKYPGKNKMENERIIQCNGERLRLGFLDFTNFLRTLVGCGTEIAIVPMNVLIFLPPACGGVDAMAKIVLHGV